MTDAVIVSTARTPIGKAYRGALNVTEGATLLGHAIYEAIKRAHVEPAEVEDVVMGRARPVATLRARRCCAPGFPQRSAAPPSTGNAPRACRRSRSPRVR
jgi:acetyl-CoA acetyltransferase